MMQDKDLNDAASMASNYTWWDGGLSAWGFKDKTVVSYHPIRFFTWLISQQKVEADSATFWFPAGPGWKLPLPVYKTKFIDVAKAPNVAAPAAAPATKTQ
jgi:hypothetical protein